MSSIFQLNRCILPFTQKLTEIKVVLCDCSSAEGTWKGLNKKMRASVGFIRFQAFENTNKKTVLDRGKLSRKLNCPQFFFSSKRTYFFLCCSFIWLCQSQLRSNKSVELRENCSAVGCQFCIQHRYSYFILYYPPVEHLGATRRSPPSNSRIAILIKKLFIIILFYKYRYKCYTFAHSQSAPTALFVDCPFLLLCDWYRLSSLFSVRHIPLGAIK